MTEKEGRDIMYMDVLASPYGRNGYAKPIFEQVLQMIDTKIVDLYQSYGVPREGARGGFLQAWIWNTPTAISPAGRRRPAVLILPGGGYNHVSVREAEPVAFRFMARGYGAFVLNYSVCPSRFPTALREAAMAMKYIREHAEVWEVNPHMVAAIGFSAGGHLCGTLGTLFDSPEVQDIGSPEWIRPDALGLCYPVAVSWGNTHEGSFDHLTGKNPELRQRLSLDHLVRKDMPPTYLWHTRTDECVPVRNALVLAQALDDKGVDFAMHIFPRGPHGLSLGDEQCYRTGNVPEKSEDVLTWPENMMKFFQKLGFSIQDAETDS